MKTLLLISILVVSALLASCGSISPENFSYVRQAAQTYQQSQSGGTYVGIASTQSEAEAMSKRAGYSRYQWYPSTGQCFGYN